ncbi:MAG: DUF1294 domain-containing protein [Clostridium sp.]|uniref:DUF1294 domain-containing protein n=1 Tax=Clostridium sp. TaxID=1506 RepID=UPI002FCB2266
MRNIFLSYLLVINIVGFISMFIDKEKAKRHKWRIPENTLMFIALIGGSIGSILGMEVFRHKTKHMKFKLGLPVILIVQIILYFMVFVK